MTPQKVLEVIGIYRNLFEDLGVEKVDCPHGELLDAPEKGLAHCHGMLEKIEKFVREGQMDKAFRWLGFIQGVLWVRRVYPLVTLRDHNRVDGEAGLEPGWLARDVARASARVAEWEAKRAQNARPVTLNKD
jgi:hypothetical protein